MIKKADIQRFYAKDADLINQFHVLAPTTLANAVEHTFKRVRECEGFGCQTTVTQNWYGTIGKHDNCTILYAFFIDVEQRKKESVKHGFLSFLKEKGVTHACVWDRNIRAKRFFKKNNFKFVMKISDDDENQEYCVYQLNP